MSNSCIGDTTNAPKTLDRTKGASLRQTSKAKKHPLAKAPFRQASLVHVFDGEGKRFVLALPSPLAFCITTLNACRILRSAWRRLYRSPSCCEKQAANHIDGCKPPKWRGIARCCDTIAAIPPIARYPSEGSLTCDTPLILFAYASKCQCDRDLYGEYSAIGCYTWKTKSDMV